MYAHILRRAAHVRRFTITTTSSSGWEVRDEVDSHIIKSRRTTTGIAWSAPG